MTGKPKYFPTIGVVVRDPDQVLFKAIKRAKEANEPLMLRANQVFGRHPSTGCRCPLCEAGVPIARLRQIRILDRVYNVKVKDMSLTWTDATSYSHGERGKKEPTTWKTVIEDGTLEITVVKNHRHLPPGMWCFHCYQLQFDTAPLPGVNDVEQAKMAALGAVRYKLETMLTALISQWPGK